MRNSSYNDLPCEQLCRCCVETPHAQEIYAALFCISVNIYKHWIYSARKPDTIAWVKFEKPATWTNQCANGWCTGKPYNDGSCLVCWKKLTVTSCHFMIVKGHSLKSKATTMSPRLLSVPPASITGIRSELTSSHIVPLQKLPHCEWYL